MTEKPETKPIDAAYLPDELCETGKFCNWNYEYEKKRDAWTKVPCSPHTGRHIDATNPDNFTDLDTALDAEHNHDGVGVGVFGNLAAIDIDHCINDAGELSELAQDIIHTMDTYTEKSPSRTGVRILCTVPDGFDYDAETEFFVNNRHNHVEVYVAGKTRHFLTLTGDAITPGFPLMERGDQLRDILDRYMRKPATDAKTHDTSIQPTGYTDEEIWNNVTTDQKYGPLFVGDISGYDSQSEADLSLCIELARWTGRDPDRIDNLFRMSGLYRDKWDRQDYRDRTINKAIELCDYLFIKDDPDVVERSKQPAPSFRAYPVGEYIRGDQFGQDIKYFKQYQNRKPGFKNLDEYLTLYPGVCSLGGAASLGKTTFCVNLADNLVRAGETVLYFSLEQEPVELVSKSLARRLYALDPFTPFSNVDIKNGATSDDLERVKREYAPDADRFIIVRCSFLTTAQEIRDYIEAYIEAHNVRPVCFIDYLQLVAAPPNFRGDQRAIVDHNIKLFKTMQLKNELFVVLISNFNRAGYDTPVGYSDFKESSMVEYTSDYVLGMQLTLLSEERFYTKYGPKGGAQNTTDKEKSDMVAAELDRYPKRVQIVSLKNRNGKQSFHCDFNYYMYNDVFTPDDEPRDDSIPPQWEHDDDLDDPGVYWN